MLPPSIKEQIREALGSGLARTERQIVDHVGSAGLRVCIILANMEENGEVVSEFVRPTNAMGHYYSDDPMDGVYHYSLP